MIKTYWSQLNERERWFLGSGFVILLGYFVYAVVYSPLSHAVELRSHQWVERQDTLAWMQRVQQQHPVLNTSKKYTHHALLSALSEQLNQSAFHTFPYQLQQVNAGEIQLVFEQVPYHAWMSWLRSSQEKYHFSIKQLTIERLKTPGLVKVSLVLV